MIMTIAALATTILSTALIPYPPANTMKGIGLGLVIGEGIGVDGQFFIGSSNHGIIGDITLRQSSRCYQKGNFAVDCPFGAFFFKNGPSLNAHVAYALRMFLFNSRWTPIIVSTGVKFHFFLSEKQQRLFNDNDLLGFGLRVGIGFERQIPLPTGHRIGLGLMGHMAWIFAPGHRLEPGIALTLRYWFTP